MNICKKIGFEIRKYIGRWGRIAWELRVQTKKERVYSSGAVEGTKKDRGRLKVTLI